MSRAAHPVRALTQGWLMEVVGEELQLRIATFSVTSPRDFRLFLPSGLLMSYGTGGLHQVDTIVQWFWSSVRVWSNREGARQFSSPNNVARSFVCNYMPTITSTKQFRE
jgi:hypothetical protein